MREFNAFVSSPYPILRALVDREREPSSVPPGHVSLALALLVNGIPSFLATVPVEEEELPDLLDSLDTGDVRVAVVGISVDGEEVRGLEADAEAEFTTDWTPPQWDAEPEPESYPAAFLSLVCRDGRRVGVARIVARAGAASPEEVARFVLRQIAQGVQIPDLASTP